MDTLSATPPHLTQSVQLSKHLEGATQQHDQAHSTQHTATLT